MSRYVFAPAVVLVWMNRSVKLPESPPLTSPDTICNALVLPAPADQVTRTSSPSTAMPVIRNDEVLFVGLVPAWNSVQLFWPSPSGSAPGVADGLLVLPK